LLLNLVKTIAYKVINIKRAANKNSVIVQQCFSRRFRLFETYYFGWQPAVNNPQETFSILMLKDSGTQ